MRFAPLQLLTAACLLTLSSTLRAGDDKVVVLHPDTTNPLAYDAPSKAFKVKAGQKVKVTMENKSVIPQPHNLLLLKPGTYFKVGQLANAMLTDPQALAKDYVPTSSDILYHTKLVQPGASASIEFTAPAEPGVYPYMCTFPGHWLLMHGEMTVEK